MAGDIKKYLGKQIITDDIRYSESSPPILPHKPAEPKKLTGIIDRKNGAELTAENLGNFLTYSLHSSLFRRQAEAIAEDHMFKVFGSETRGRDLTKVLRNLNPYNENSWEEFVRNIGDPEIARELKTLWEKGLNDQNKYKSLETLFTRCAEEVVVALSEKMSADTKIGLSEEALQNIVFETISYAFTAHPNGKLHKEAEPLVRELIVKIFQSDPKFIYGLAKWNGKAEELKYDPYFERGYQVLEDIWLTHSKPSKMTPKEERERQQQSAVDMYDACRSYMNKYHQLFDAPKMDLRGKDFFTLSEIRKKHWGVSTGFVSLAELAKMNPPKMRSWVIGDADGKTATQPETILQGIKEVRQSTLNMHFEALSEIKDILASHAQIFEGQYNKYGIAISSASTEIDEIIKTLQAEMKASAEGKIGSVLSAKELEKRIAELKEKYEQQGVVFDYLDEDGYPKNNYSKLDVLYVNVRRCGDFFPQVEIRQNFKENKMAVEYVGKLLRENGLIPEDLDISSNPEALLQMMKENPVVRKNTVTGEDVRFADEVQNLVLIEYDRLTDKLNPGPNKLSEDELVKNLSALRDKNLSKEEMHARQVLGIFILNHEYPSSISSYVIAEAATADQAVKAAHKCEAENVFTDGIDPVGESVVNNGIRDYKNLMVLEQITASVPLKITSPDFKGVMKLIQLFEDPPSILNQIKVWQEMVADPKIRERMALESKPAQIFDQETKRMRDMTAADYKIARGLEAKKGDEKILVYEGPELMDAGSDASGRGTTLMNVVIAIVRQITNETLLESPVEINGQQAVILPKNHAGVGAGNPRSQDKGNTPDSQISVQTNQGILNLLSLVNPALAAMRNQVEMVRHQYGIQDEKDKEAHDKACISPDYKGNGQRNLTRKDMLDIVERCVAVMNERMDMVYSEPFSQHLTNNVHGWLANSMNFSAREAKRDGGIKEEVYPARTEYETLRLIGVVNRLYIAGDCGSETQTEAFFVRDAAKDLQQKDGATLLSSENRENLIRYHKNASYVTNAMSGLSVVTTYANFDNSWKMAGLTHGTDESGKYFVTTKKGEKHLVSDLHALLKKSMQGEDIELPKGIHLGHLALADHQRQFMGFSQADAGMAKHVYELYFRMQNGDEKGNLEPAKEKELIENIRSFTPEKILDVMPEHMQRVCKKHKELMDFARDLIAEDHLSRMESGGKKPALTAEQAYQLATIHDLLKESGPTVVEGKKLSVTVYPEPQVKQQVARTG